MAEKVWTFQENDVRADHVVAELREKGVHAEITPPDWGKATNGIRIWMNDDVAAALGIMKPSGGRLGTPCMEESDA